jgi:NO-binding membrane sensor protein with MHYT domain
MSSGEAARPINSEEPANGAGAAAVLAAGAGTVGLAVIAIAADQMAAVRSAMIFYRPTGPLSGVTTSALILWVAVWIVLHLRWRRKDVAMGRVGAWALALLVLGVLLTFPPLADLL